MAAWRLFLAIGGSFDEGNHGRVDFDLVRWASLRVGHHSNLGGHSGRLSMGRFFGVTNEGEMARVQSKESPLKGKTLQVKYRNPKNPAEAWTGRGHTPNWIKRELNQGVDLESLKVS
jgi:hypothetical protein